MSLMYCPEARRWLSWADEEIRCVEYCDVRELGAVERLMDLEGVSYGE
jgi:hypothetical protein